MAKGTNSKKMTEAKRANQRDRRQRRQQWYRVGALLLVAVMTVSLVAVYAF